MNTYDVTIWYRVNDEKDFYTLEVQAETITAALKEAEKIVSAKRIFKIEIKPLENGK